MLIPAFRENRDEQMDRFFVFEPFISPNNGKEKMDESRLNSLGRRDDHLRSVVWSCVCFINERKNGK